MATHRKTKLPPDIPRQKSGRQKSNRSNKNGKHNALPGPLTPSGTIGPASHVEATAVNRRALRRWQAVELLDQELTYEQIGDRLGVHPSTVCRDLEEAHKELLDARIDTLEHRRQREERLTYRNDRAILPMLYGQGIPTRKEQQIVGTGKAAKVVTLETAPDPVRVAALKVRAHERLTASSERRAKLFGVDLQAGEGHFTADQVMSMIRQITGLFLEVVTDLELRRQFTIGLRRTLGPSMVTVDAETVPSANGHGSNGHGQ